MEVHPVLVQVSWTMSIIPGFFMEFIWKSLESMDKLDMSMEVLQPGQVRLPLMLEGVQFIQLLIFQQIKVSILNLWTCSSLVHTARNSNL
jgi:hypothetical protein